MNEADFAYVIDDGQLGLFPMSPREHATKSDVPWVAILWLFEHGWLSFDPSAVRELSHPEAAELVFLGSLVKKGCDAEMLEGLLKGMRRPASYDVNKIYYDWRSGAWRLLPRLEPLDRSQVLDDWLEELVQEADLLELEDLERRIAEAVAAVRQARHDDTVGDDGPE
jgi:hypothetical protein